uniref:Fimbrial assembly protein n=1 Tax=Neobacillus citreus TaxID=2833578 RepID=A0A942SXP4_9BACI
MSKILEPKAGRPARGRSQEARIAADSAQRTKRQGRGHAQALVVGGRPHVDLLPTEVLVDRRQRAVVRRAWLGVVVVAVAAVTGIVLASASAMQAEDTLAAERQETDSLLAQQQQYRDVRTTEAQRDLLRAAQSVGGSTEIDWQSTLRRVQASLPAGVTITGVQIDSATPFEAYTQATGPLQGQRVATLTIDAASPTLPSVPAWLESVRGLPGFVDANANSVTLDASTNTYTVDMTIHLDDDVYDGKYDLEDGS